MSRWMPVLTAIIVIFLWNSGDIKAHAPAPAARLSELDGRCAASPATARVRRGQFEQIARIDIVPQGARPPAAEDTSLQLHALGRSHPCRIGIRKTTGRPGRQPHGLAQHVQPAEIAAGRDLRECVRAGGRTRSGIRRDCGILVSAHSRFVANRAAQRQRLS